ncbi:hypothetical protein [Cupriavidus necator]
MCCRRSCRNSGRTRVTIDHSALPAALKGIAAGAVQAIWQAANEAATGELATLRAEAPPAAIAAESESESESEPDAARRGLRPRRPVRRWPPSRRSWPRHPTCMTPCRRT